MVAQSLTTKILAGGALLGVVTAALTAWGTYGWVTKEAYAAEHEGASIKVQQAAILESLEALTATLVIIKEEQSKNQDQWECDETDEELKDIGISLAGELSTIERVEFSREKDKLDDVWEAKRCTRFTD
jgi:hypothetical protein